jgi:hypothetical protein
MLYGSLWLHLTRIGIDFIYPDLPSTTKKVQRQYGTATLSRATTKSPNLAAHLIIPASYRKEIRNRVKREFTDRIIRTWLNDDILWFCRGVEDVHCFVPLFPCLFGRSLGCCLNWREEKEKRWFIHSWVVGNVRVLLDLGGSSSRDKESQPRRNPPRGRQQGGRSINIIISSIHHHFIIRRC